MEIEANGNLRVKLLTEYGIDTDEYGNIINERNKVGEAAADERVDPEGVF